MRKVEGLVVRLDRGSSNLPGRIMRMGLGLAALGHPGYLNLGHGEDLGADRSVEALRRRAHAVLDAAYEGGVRTFDAARSYGRAEEFLGQWLDSRRPKGVTVSSKWGEWLALYQIHSATPESGVLEDDEVLAELEALRAGGLAVGVSVSGTTQAVTIDQALQLGLFDAVQATWNLYERPAEPALVRAHS